jgi:hypothetical protein
MMKKLIALLLATVCSVATTAVAASYSTEATITQQKNIGRFFVEVRVSQLLEQGGKLTEQEIARPRFFATPEFQRQIIRAACYPRIQTTRMKRM